MQLSRQNLYRKALGLPVEAEVRRAGTFLYVDAGQLDLGIVRDSHLNAANDFQLFGETFENVAKIASGYDMPTSIIIYTTEL